MFKFYRSVLAAGVVALGLAACGDNAVVAPPPPPPPSAGVTSVTLTPANASVGIGQSIQIAASVVADSGVATTLNWTTSNALIATVSATGLVTGVGLGTTTIIATSTANPARSAAVGITVTSSSVFNISPATMSLAPGQSSSATATISLSAGQTATAIVWTSLAPSIATVSGSCTTTAGTSVCPITGVSQGSAVISASTTVAGQTFTQTVAVTVGAGASISLSSVTAGATAGLPGCPGVVGAPVILTNVACQIDVNLNLSAGVQPLDSLVVSVKQGAAFKTAAKQIYGNTIPSSGLVTLSIVTGRYTKFPVLGTAVPDFFNGPTSVIIQVFPHNAVGGTVVNCQTGANDPTCIGISSMILNNVDGWVADLAKPTNSATDVGGAAVNAGTTYWGGPGTTGQSAVQLYAVVYNNNPAFPAGSALNRCTGVNGVGCISTVTWSVGSPAVGGAGNCGFPVSATQTALPFKQVMGNGTGATNACVYENTTAIRDNLIVAAALDAQAAPYALVGTASGLPLPANPNTTLISNIQVFGSTPDSLRLDYKPPTVPTPSIARVAPAVTGWVNASFNFINFTGVDGGVGATSSTRAATWTSVNCPTVVATNAPMPTGTGADINTTVACPTNFIGGAVGLGGTAPWTVSGTEADRLGNVGTSVATATFGTDYTAPAIRWGLVDGAFPLPAAYGGSIADPVDSTRFQTAVIKAAGVFGEFRAEYLDERSGFYAAGQVLAGTAAQSQTLATAGHLNPVGLCQIGSAPVGATFVTNPGCGFTPITVGTLGVRIDGWQPGQRLNVPLPEGYYGYKTWVTDAAGNQSVTLFRSVLINNQSPFSTGLGVPAILTSTNFNFIATFSDSAEVIKQSLQVVYPFAAATIDSFRFNQSFLAQLAPAPALAAAFDDFITSPFSGNIAPPTGTPYAHSIEQTTAAVFPASNVNGAGVQAKPTKVLAWSWNPGSLFSPGGPTPGVSPEIPIPGLNVENNNNIATFNVANPTIAITHFRIITTVGATNQFGSTVPLRAQVESPTNAPNPPFSRVDFFRQVGGAFWSYLGSAPGSVVQLSAACSSSVSEVCGTDQGTYRSWVYQLATSYQNRWDGVAQGTVVSGDLIIAVGVVSTGDALATQTFTMIP